MNIRSGLLVILIVCAAPTGLSNRPISATRRWRDFRFTYIAHVPVLSGGKHRLKLWIPLPSTSSHQSITDLHIASPIPHRVITETQYGDRMANFDFATSCVHTPFDVVLTFRARRYEYRISLPSSDPAPSRVFPHRISRYLQPDRLIPLNGIIGELSREQTASLSDPLAKARAIYDYVTRTMHYDHSGTGWGRGDAVWACSSHHGNCTDFHSLFIGMARAAGIPARFDIGFPLPLHAHDGKINGYHCWAEFYINGVGWVPIDAAEGSQMSGKRSYFFGAVDQNRILFSRGRDLVLNPVQSSSVVNYLVYPYAELDGKPFGGIAHSFYFKDLRSGAPQEPSDQRISGLWN
jgi:hypothetical protein